MVMTEKKDIKSYNLDELKQELANMGEKPFRAGQIYKWGIARFTIFAIRNGRMIPSPRRTPSVAILMPIKMKK